MNPAMAGIPVYPGSDRVKDGGATIRWNPKNGDSDKDLLVVGGEFRTPDPVSRVVDYYRAQLPSLIVISGDDESTRLEYRKGGMRRIISVRRENGETSIGVASVGEGASN
jgi:hypothetical protein